MTEEASAAVRGAIAGGASSVVVADSHGTMQNLVADQLDSRARLISGSPRMFSMVQGLDASFDALVFVGFHSAAGNFGVMAHTFNGQAFTRIEIEGRLVGEVELFAGYAAELNIPLAVVTGDDFLAREVSALFPDAKTVVVKECLGGWASNSLSPKSACQLIETSIKTKLKEGERRRIDPPRNGPFTVEIEMTKQFFADACCLLPEMDRISATRISFESKSYSHAVRVIQALSYIVMGVVQ